MRTIKTVIPRFDWLLAECIQSIHHKFQSRFYECKTAKEIWNLAIADASNEVVRVDSALKSMDLWSAEELDASVFVNKLTLALRTFCELGNELTVATKIAELQFNSNKFIRMNHKLACMAKGRLYMKRSIPKGEEENGKKLT